MQTPEPGDGLGRAAQTLYDAMTTKEFGEQHLARNPYAGLHPLTQDALRRAARLVVDAYLDAGDAPDPIRGLSVLDRLRLAGWSVGVHNDYRLDGVAHTFWLLTHAVGKWVKGEGRTDADALRAAADGAGALGLPAAYPSLEQATRESADQDAEVRHWVIMGNDAVEGIVVGTELQADAHVQALRDADRLADRDRGVGLGTNWRAREAVPRVLR
jgi:hypothetical protein